MVFECFRDGKCEWQKGLHDFTAQFNRKFDKNYKLSKCLDVSGDTRNKPQPEVLLTDDNELPIVIECKKIVYPEDYFERHRKFHRLFDCFSRIFHQELKGLLPDERYEIEVSSHIYNFNSSEAEKEVIEPIIRQILESIQSLPSSRYRISDDLPIPWAFRKLAVHECEEDESGFGVRVMLWNNLLPSLQDLNAVEAHVSEKLNKHLDAASRKFVDYENCVKILIIELCGDPLSIPSSDRFEEICSQVSMPKLVNQIWLAEPGFGESVEYYKVR